MSTHREHEDDSEVHLTVVNQRLTVSHPFETVTDPPYEIPTKSSASNPHQVKIHDHK